MIALSLSMNPVGYPDVAARLALPVRPPRREKHKHLRQLQRRCPIQA
jgi:hypothetical protein